MATYNAAYEATAKTMDEARAASYEQMKKLTEGIRRDPNEGVYINTNIPLANVSIAYNDMMKSNLTASIFPNVEVNSGKYYTTGVFTTSAKAGDIATALLGGEKNMNITAKTARVKAGFLAQILNGQTIVWESKKAYKNAEKAIKVANSKIDSSIDKLFNK